MQKENVIQGWMKSPTDPNYYMYREVPPVAAAVPAGLYDINADKQRGFFLQGKDIVTDRLIMMEGAESDAVMREIKQFVARKAEFVKRGFLHKRGILLCGDPGSGKSATIHMVARQAVETMDALVMYVGGRVVMAMHAFAEFRKIEPQRLFVAVIEDIDNIIAEGDEEELLSLLDGENQVDNIVYIATTNYPHNLPRRVWDRPSRFDSIVYVPLPNARLREEFLRDKEPEYTSRDIEHAVKETEGFTIAHLKEFIILNRCFGMGIAQAAKRIRDTRDNKLFKEKKEDQ